MLFQSPRTSKPQPVYRQHEYTDDRMAELDRLIAAGLGDVRPVQHRKKRKPCVRGLARYTNDKRSRLDTIAAIMREKYARRACRGEMCSAAGCDRFAEVRGMCGMHYQRDRRARNGHA